MSSKSYLEKQHRIELSWSDKSTARWSVVNVAPYRTKQAVQSMNCRIGQPIGSGTAFLGDIACFLMVVSIDML